MCAHHSCKGLPACITTPALAEGPSESMAPTLGWPFFLDLSKAGEVEKSADREEEITEQPISGLWRRDEDEKLGTRFLEREARSPAICNGFDTLYCYRSSAILDNFGHKITVYTKCNLSSHVDLLSKMIRSTIKSLSAGGSGGSARLPNSVLQAVGKPRRFVINS